MNWANGFRSPNQIFNRNKNPDKNHDAKSAIGLDNTIQTTDNTVLHQSVSNISKETPPQRLQIN